MGAPDARPSEAPAPPVPGTAADRHPAGEVPGARTASGRARPAGFAWNSLVAATSAAGDRGVEVPVDLAGWSPSARDVLALRLQHQLATGRVTLAGRDPAVAHVAGIDVTDVTPGFRVTAEAARAGVPHDVAAGWTARDEAERPPRR